MQRDPFRPEPRKPKFGVQFTPSVRGDIAAALKDSASLAHISPQSPRPEEMLVGYEFKFAGVDYTANDDSVREMLITNAVSTDPKMAKSSYEIPLTQLVHLIGPEARPDTVEASLRRLEKIRITFRGDDGRTYEDVQVLTTWKAIRGAEKEVRIGYQFPDPVRDLMRTMPRYAYIEHAALAQGNMKSRYSGVVYKWLAFEVSKNPWKADSDNKFTVTISPEELSAMVQLPLVNGRVDFSRLNARVLGKLSDDLKAVRKFDVEIAFDGGAKPKPGRPVELIEFHVTVNADHHRVTSSRDVIEPELRESMKGVRWGAPDSPEYRLPSNFWNRVVRKFKTLLLIKSAVHPIWVVALQEAIDEAPISDGYRTRRFRGPRLLEAIAKLGVTEAAWQFFAEEASAGPDLSLNIRIYDRIPKAKRSQLERFRASKATAASKTDIVVEAMEPKVQIAAIPIAEPVAPNPIPEFKEIEVFVAPMDFEVASPANEPPKALSGVVPFAGCNVIEITADELESGVIENMVIERLEDRVWGNGPRRTLRIRYLVGGNWASHDIAVTPEDEEEVLEQIQRSKAAPYIDGQPLFLRITK